MIHLRYIVTCLVLFIFFSCKKNSVTIQPTTDATIETDSLPKMKAFHGTFSVLTTPFIQAKKEEILRYQNYIWNQNNRISGGFLVAKNGKIIYEHYQGFANQEDSIVLQADSPIHIASVSKVLTAAAILKLIDTGKLTLDEKVITWLPSFPYPEISIKMLLNHRSGLPNYAYFTANDSIWDSHKLLSNQDIVTLLHQHRFPLQFEPDSHFSYCNTNYAILALVIEKITGENYRTAMKKMIFEPLKMNHTYVFDYKKDTATASQSYTWRNQRYEFNYLDDIYGDKNIYSTPRDLLQFDLATYNDDFLNIALKEQVYKGYSYEKKGVKNYGLGIRLMEWESSPTLFYHNGWWHGNNSSYLHLQQDSVTIIALGNKYTRQMYSVMNLAGLFGDYPLKPDELYTKDSIPSTLIQDTLAE